MVALIKLLGGIYLLIWGSNKFVESASIIACKYSVSSMFIGLTLVAFGTSLPEMAVSLGAMWNAEGIIAIGNIIGSNIANTFLILGFGAVLSTTYLSFKDDTWSLYYMLVITIVFFLILISGSFNFLLGFFLFLLVGLFIWFLIKNKGIEQEFDKIIPKNYNKNTYILVAFSFVSLIALLAGSQLTVSSSIEFAKLANVSKFTVSLLLVAIGTSLPELAITFSAARKGETNIIIGNVIGSNIINILVVGGATLMAGSPMWDKGYVINGAIMLVSAFICLPFAITNLQLDKKMGTLLIIMFLAYAIFSAYTGITEPIN